jgi:hypothetical protein
MAPRLRLPKLRKSDNPPTRQVSGTPYTATGAKGVKPPSLQELGSQQGSQWPDPIGDVGTPVQASRTYTKMVRDDASVRVSLRAGKAPVLGADFFIEPFDDNPQNLAIQEFVEFNLFHGMTTSWIRVLEQVLTMYEYGKSVFEPVWENREWAPKKSQTGANRRQYTMLRKLSYRPNSTISRVNYDDNGGPVSVTHNAIDSKGKLKQVDIPMEKLVVFTFDQQGGGIDGMPILRSAYKHWIYKDKLYTIDAIQKERHGMGVPMAVIGPGASPEDIKLVDEMLANIRTNEKAYIRTVQSIPISFAELKGQPVDVMKSIEHHDNMIMKNILVQFINAGSSTEGGGGSRASGATQMDMFMKSMRHIATTICEAINLYLIPNLVAYNFDTDQFPQLKVRNVGETRDLQMFAAALKNLKDSNLISVDEATENWIRDMFDMPKFTGDWVLPEARPSIVEEILKGDAPTNGNQPTNGATPTKGSHSPSGALTGNIGKQPGSAD